MQKGWTRNMLPQTDQAGLTARMGRAREVLVRAMDHFGDGLWLAWTGAKDSTLVLWLARGICLETGREMPRVVTIDEGDPFPEVLAFQDRLIREWGLRRLVVRNEELLGRGRCLGDLVVLDELSPALRQMAATLGFTAPVFPLDPESPLGNQLLKVAPLQAFLREYAVRALATAIRADEHPSRAGERHESPREHPPHTRVHPLLHVSEADVWAVTLGEGVPFCELYAAGYRSLGTRSGTSRTGDRPAWEQDLGDRAAERAGRAQGKEAAMADLRSLGYM